MSNYSVVLYYTLHTLSILLKTVDFKTHSFNKDMDTHKDVITRLKFISRINKGDKINVRNAYPYVQPNDLSTSFSRTFLNKDNRGNSLHFIRNTIDRSYEIISMFKNSNKKSELLLCSNIIQDLKKAKNGIQNLKNTYISDTMFGCEMDTILESIDRKIIELDELEELKESLTSSQNTTHETEH